MRQAWVDNGKGTAAEFNARWKTFNIAKKKVCGPLIPVVYLTLPLRSTHRNIRTRLYVTPLLPITSVTYAPIQKLVVAGN